MANKILHFLLIFIYIFFSFFFPLIFSDSSIDGFIYGGCSQIKYSPGSPYESNLNSLLTSLVNSATYSSYNKYSIVGSTQQDTINGLYQCRGDLSMPDCATCLARSVSQVTELCPQTCGGALQLQGCFVKYDNFSFLGSEDKTVVMKKCGPSNGFDIDEMGRRDAVLGSLMGGNGLYRVGGSEDVQGMAQCVGDLSMAQCQDCLSEAIGRLKKECGGGVYGDIFLGKCYARYTTKGAHLYAKPNHHGETFPSLAKDLEEYVCLVTPPQFLDSHSESERTFALIIGLLAGVALLIIFLTFMRRICGRNGK